jgi:hypothetical protein
MKGIFLLRLFHEAAPLEHPSATSAAEIQGYEDREPRSGAQDEQQREMVGAVHSLTLSSCQKLAGQ